MPGYYVAEADPAAVAAGNCYLALLVSSEVLAGCSGILRYPAEVPVLHYGHYMTVVVGSLRQGGVVENCWRMVVVVDLVEWALLCLGFRAWLVDEDTGRDRKGLALGGSHVEELVGSKGVESYYSVADNCAL